MTQHVVSDSGPQTSLLPSPTTPTLNNIDHHPHENHNPSHSPPTADVYASTNGPSSSIPHSKQWFRGRTTDIDTRLEESSHSDNEVSLSRTLRRRELRGIVKPEHSAHKGNLDPITMDGTMQRIHKLNSLKLSTSTNGGFKAAINGNMKKGSISSGSCTIVTENHYHKVESEVSMDVPRALVRASAISKDDSHVLRSRTASSPRVRPYVVNHKVVDKSS